MISGTIYDKFAGQARTAKKDDDAEEDEGGDEKEQEEAVKEDGRRRLSSSSSSSSSSSPSPSLLPPPICVFVLLFLFFWNVLKKTNEKTYKKNKKKKQKKKTKKKNVPHSCHTADKDGQFLEDCKHTGPVPHFPLLHIRLELAIHMHSPVLVGRRVGDTHHLEALRRHGLKLTDVARGVRDCRGRGTLVALLG